MIGTSALIAALLFVGAALYRFAPAAPRWMRRVQLGAALAAGALGFVHWSITSDSRWLVGGILLLGAAYPGWAAGNRRTLTIVALVVGVLGTALYGIALRTPMVRAAVTASA